MAVLSSKQKTIVLLTVCILSFSTGFAASNWNIYDKPDLNPEVASFDSPTIQVVNITAETTDTTLTPDDNVAYPVQLIPDYLSNSYNITQTYNETNGTAEDLTHWRNGLWYGEFIPNMTAGNQVLFSANGTTSEDGVEDSNETANYTKSLNMGDYSVELQDSYDLPVKAGMQFELEAVVTNSTGNIKDDNETSVEVYFVNPDEETGTTQIDNWESGEFYNSRVNYPDNPNSTYLMHVTATNDDTGDIEGTTSRMIKIAPQVRGEISQFSAQDGCASQSNVSNCEQGANIDTEYSITNAEAENVNLSVYAFNNSGRTMIDTMNLTEESSTLFSGSIDVPDVNSSKYSKEIEFKFNATNRDRESVDRHNVTVESFKIQDRSDPTTYLGQEYEPQIFLGKPYSLNDYGKDRFESITVNITDSNGDLFETFSTSDLSYSSTQGVMEASTVIEEGNPTGSYSLDIQAENIYGEEKTLSSGFSVSDVDATFQAEDSVEVNVNRLEPTEFTIDIENLLQQENEVQAEVTELEDQLTVLNESLTLSSEEQTEIVAEANLSELQDKEGEIKLMDASTNYNETVDVELDTPSCEFQAGDLCSETAELDVSAGSTGEILETIDLRYIGAQGGSVNYNTTVEGGVGPYVTVENQNEEVEISGENEVTITFTPEATGTYTGDIVFETGSGEEFNLPVTLSYQTTSDSGGEGSTGSSGVSISTNPSELDLGYIREGGSVSESIIVTNEGTQTSESLSVSSQDFTVSTDFNSQIGAETSNEITLDFESIETQQGEVEFEAGDSATLDVTANVVSNRAGDLRDRKNQLQGRAEDGSTEMGDLTDLSAEISSYETELEAGNLEAAQETYSEIDSTLTQIDNQINTGSEGEDGSTTPPPPGSEEENSGGLPILPIGGAILVLLIIGFVVYTSYIPEKGDPLYSVLGDRQ